MSAKFLLIRKIAVNPVTQKSIAILAYQTSATTAKHEFRSFQVINTCISNSYDIRVTLSIQYKYEYQDLESQSESACIQTSVRDGIISSVILSTFYRLRCHLHQPCCLIKDQESSILQEKNNINYLKRRVSLARTCQVSCNKQVVIFLHLSATLRNYSAGYIEQLALEPCNVKKKHPYPNERFQILTT